MSVVDAFLLSGFSNAGTPFETASTPERATAPDENARRSMYKPSVLAPFESSRASSEKQTLRDGAEVLHEDSVQPNDDQDDQHDDVKIRRPRKCSPRFLHPAKVHHGHHRNTEQTYGHRPLRVKTECGFHGKDTTGDAYRNGEDVVDEQRRSSHQGGNLAKILTADDVGTATGWIGHDGLSVRQNHDGEEYAHHDRNRHDRTKGRKPDARLNCHNDHDFVGRIRRRGDCVGSKHRESDALAEPLVTFIRRGDRLSDEYPLD